MGPLRRGDGSRGPGRTRARWARRRRPRAVRTPGPRARRSRGWRGGPRSTADGRHGRVDRRFDAVRRARGQSCRLPDGAARAVTRGVIGRELRSRSPARRRFARLTDTCAVRTTLGIALVGLVATVIGCSSSSLASGLPPDAAAATTLGPSPSPSATVVETLPATSRPATEVATMSPGPFTLTSTAFDDGGAIPRRFTCDDSNASPDVQWSGAPDGTQALVLTVIDPDARDFVHWIVYDMDGSSAGSLPTGISSSPDAPPQGLNSFGKRGYGGPRSPSGRPPTRFPLAARSCGRYDNATPTPAPRTR